MSNLTLFYDNNRKFFVENQPIPEPGPNEVLVKIDASGICGTDLHLWKDLHFGDAKIEKPHVLGHESGATVVKVGKNVTHLKAGDIVCLEPAIACWKCYGCKSGHYQLCTDPLCNGQPPEYGHFRQYLVHPAEFAHKLPSNVSIKDGALIEPLTCAVHAIERAKVSMGHKVFVCGAGSIGILILLAAKAAGATKVCMADIRQSRLDSAKKIGADEVILVDTKDTQAIADRVVQLLGEKPDVTIDCSGTESGLQTCALATKPGGLVQAMGIPPKNVTLPLLHMVLNEIDFVGSLRFDVTNFKTAMSLVSSGKINLKNVITHRFTLQEAEKAFQVAGSGADGSVKVTISPADSN